MNERTPATDRAAQRDSLPQAAGGSGGRDGSAPQLNEDEAERVPTFGTWPRIYAAVVLSAVVVMALVYVFSVWPY
jgi:hypothetical protein